MTSLNFPDINVWLALATPEHVHAPLARAWWESESGSIAFIRLSQLGFLRLMTTGAVMSGKPLTNAAAFRVYDRFFEDDRVVYLSEPAEAEADFRKRAGVRTASPKIWADAWMLAVAQATDGRLITFDRALAGPHTHCLIAR